MTSRNRVECPIVKSSWGMPAVASRREMKEIAASLGCRFLYARPIRLSGLWNLVTLIQFPVLILSRYLFLRISLCSSTCIARCLQAGYCYSFSAFDSTSLCFSSNSSFPHSRGFSIPDALRYTIIARITPAVMSKCPRLRRKRNNSTPRLRLLRASRRHDPGRQSRRNQRTNILSSNRRRHLRNLSTSWRVGRHKPSHQFLDSVPRDADCAGGIFTGCTNHG
jgi:hypothetical protein